MSSLINFWPFKSFFSYVFKRSFGKFIKNNIDLDLYDFSKKKITFKSLDLNTQLINEALKDSPFKIISCSVGKLQINKPSLNLLTQKINIEVANVDLILMPVFHIHERKDQNDEDNDSKDEEEKESDERDESHKTEEFNILNNLVNKILSNLEVKISSITIRILTKEIKQEMSEDIPTLLVRFNNIEYKRFVEQSTDVKPVSDLQVILDGKALEVQEISVHYMRSTNLYSDELCHKNPQLAKLKFPQEYPLVNHPSTILLIKPIIGQQATSTRAIEAKLYFNKEVPQNKLFVQAKVPNMEFIIEMNQLRGLLLFTCDVINYVKLKDCGDILSKEEIGLNPLNPKAPTLDDGILDLYGTMIRNNQNIKEVNISPTLIKTKIHNIQQNSKPLTNDQKKMALRKEKMICQFLKQTQDKKEFLKLKEDLKRSVTQSTTDEAMMASQLLEQSVYQDMPDKTRKDKPLSLNIELVLSKISGTVIFNENGIAYDHIFDSFALTHSTVQNPLISINAFDDQNLKRVDQKIGYSHYNLEIRQINLGFQLSNLRKKSHNPFKKFKNSYEKAIKLQLELKSLQLNRYDLVDQPSLQMIQLQQNLNDTTCQQYESFSQSSVMFQSAQEFHFLNSEIGESRYLDKSTMSKRQHHQQPSGQDNQQNVITQDGSLQANQMHFYSNLYRLNHSLQHFCKQTILEVQTIPGSESKILFLNLQIKEEVGENDSKFVTQGQLALGFLNINFGYNDMMFLSQLVKGIIIVDAQIKETPKERKKNKMESFEVIIQGLQLEFISVSSKRIDLNYLLDGLIENKPLEHLCQRSCYCHDQQSIHETLLVAIAASISVKLRPNGSLYIGLDSLELQSINNNQKLSIVELHKLAIDIAEEEVSTDKKSTETNCSPNKTDIQSSEREFEGKLSENEGLSQCQENHI